MYSGSAFTSIYRVGLAEKESTNRHSELPWLEGFDASVEAVCWLEGSSDFGIFGEEAFIMMIKEKETMNITGN